LDGVWESALPATDFDLSLKRLSVKILDAFDATEGLVCLVFFGIMDAPFFCAIHLNPIIGEY
jgi:hypothetical protein